MYPKEVLHGNKLSEVPADSFKNLKHLKELGLDSNNLRHFDLTDLPNSLTKLWLSNNSIRELDFESLSADCPNLQLFDLSFNSVSKIEAEAWPESLVNFYVAGNGIKELDVKKIPASLEILDVGGMDVSIGFNAGKSLVNCIEDLDVTAMAHWSKLKILDVAYNQIDRVEEKNIPVSCIAFFAAQNRIRAFRTARLNCDQLQILDLSNNMYIETFDSTRLPSALRILNLLHRHMMGT